MTDGSQGSATLEFGLMWSRGIHRRQQDDRWCDVPEDQAA